MPTKAGSKCPIVGRAIADKIRGWTSAGPGPIKVLTGGLNDFIRFINIKIKKPL
jgi:hypothetical protein